MSAYIVVELTLRDPAARDRYSAGARSVLQEFGGEVVAGGAWQVLYGEPAFANGALIAFKDRETALAFYNAPAYQALLADREAGIDCRFRVIG
jgi:uncharacterized protein (DUF1330 family)